jgi:hypothetical protein
LAFIVAWKSIVAAVATDRQVAEIAALSSDVRNILPLLAVC